MTKRIGIYICLFLFSLCAPLSFTITTQAQQTLGGITGTVTDTTGAVVPGVIVSLVGDQTKLTRTQTSGDSGSYLFTNLPIGTYSLTFSHEGFESQNIPSIAVQANRTMTVNAALKVGEVNTTVTVEETPLVNAVDTTNGYVLDKQEFEAVPLPTGSFTGVAILSAGVSSEVSNGTGANSGLGNAPIWSNGQRDTSNTFLMNGVDASNLFNGKSTSSVSSARVVNNTGIGGAASISSTTAEPIQSTASPYLAIGQALPTPAPETVQEFRVNTSMYGASQGSTSGAHIDMSTAAGTNQIHGSAYGHRGTNWINADPFFYNQNPNIPEGDKNPGLHRYTAGGTVGGPIIKDKLFYFLSYQHVQSSDAEIGSSRFAVPDGLTSAVNRMDPAALAGVINGNFLQDVNPVVGTAPGDINPIAFGLLNYRLPKTGQYLIPNNTLGQPISVSFPENSFTLGTAYFFADQAVGDVDYIVNSKDVLALKYYYQHDPSVAPYAYSGAPGFTQNLDAGSQVASITNTQTLKPNLSVAETIGFIREKVFSTIQQPFTPQQFASYVESIVPGISPADATINTFGSPYFPGISIVDDYGNEAAYNTGFVFNAATNIGMGAASQGAWTGIFQNRLNPSANATWTVGKHTVTFGGSFTYTQLNARDQRPGKGMIGFSDFSQFALGQDTSYSPDGFITSAYLQGNANRYYRANDTGEYIEDKFQLRSNFSVSAGIRFDYHGGMTEKNGNLYNFNPALYNYDQATDTIADNGFIIAGNNKLFPSKGVSDSTLTGRQWGFAPRIGVAWSPSMFKNKVVVRAGWGMYYDRGELFTYLSPGFAAGVIAGGPFGVNQSPPFVNSQVCTDVLFSPFATCNPATAGNPYSSTVPFGGNFENPWGATLGPPPTGNPATLVLPNAAAINDGAQLFSFANYNRKNKLPYTMNESLDVQWQPRNDLVITIGYVGNLGRHEIVPLPFNQAGIATPTNPIHGQKYTYGYTVQGPAGCNPTLNPAACAPVPGVCDPTTQTSTGCAPIGLPDGSTMLENFEGGNIDLRVPYIGYSSESLSYTAAGVSAYNALQVHVEKRLSRGLQIGGSYTYSHATDEQSGLGLFYNGNNPNNLRSGYGLSDFDRTHVINFTYVYEFPKPFAENSLKGKLVNGWQVAGLTILQSGQPYSVIDYSGAVGSIFYGVSDGIINPVVPLTFAPGCSVKGARTSSSGAYNNGVLALNPDCFTVPLIPVGGLNGAIPPGDVYENNFVSNGQRNIFRQTWQKRADISIQKITQVTEHVSVKYTFDVFNVTNTPSFDVPVDNIDQNIAFNGFPIYGTPALPCGGDVPNPTFYTCPSTSGLGIVNKTIGSSRQIQMSLSVLF